MKKYFIFSILLLASNSIFSSEKGDTENLNKALAAIQAQTPSFNPDIVLTRGASQTFGDLKTATVRLSHNGKSRTIGASIPSSEAEKLSPCTTRSGNVRIYITPGALLAHVHITGYQS